jgi:hypothetical protein
VARVHPKALDGAEGSFVLADLPTPGAPNQGPGRNEAAK